MRNLLPLIALLVIWPAIQAQQAPDSRPTTQPTSAPTPPSFLDLRATLEDDEATDAERRRALAQLGPLDDERVAPYLLEIFEKPDFAGMRSQIVSALANHPATPGVRELIVAQMREGADFATRSAAVRALREVEPEWKDVYRKILADDEDRQLHSNVVFAIAYSDDEGALDFLREIMKGHSENLGALVINYATNRFGIDETYKDFIQPHLRKQAEDNLKYAAIAALGQKNDKRFMPALGRHLSRQEREKTAARWLPLLGRLDDPQAFDLMLDLMKQRNTATERSFQDAAGEMAHPKILAWFRDRGAKEQDPLIRRAAIASMSAHPDERNVAVLKRLCDGDDEEIAGRAISALAKHPSALVVAILDKLIRRGSVPKAADALEARFELSRDDEAFVADLLAIAGESRAWELRVVAMRLLQEKHAARAREVFIKNAKQDRGALRIAAYEALTYLRDKEVVDFLVSRLDHEDGRPAGELVAALTNLTGTQWGRRIERWKSWWPKVRDELPLPPRPERSVVVTEDDGNRYGFYGIDIDSTRVAFVIDTSGSMSARSNTGTTDRIYQAKNELKSALSRFGEKHAFEIIAFTHTPKPYAGTLVMATPTELDKARAWVDALTAAGGTNIYDSLVLAMEIPDVDTVFLLSDGAPGSGRIVDTDLILDAIRRMNRFRRIKINAIGIGVRGDARRLVEQLAAQNWGVSVIL